MTEQERLKRRNEIFAPAIAYARAGMQDLQIFDQSDEVTKEMWVKAAAPSYMALCPVCGAGRSDSYGSCEHAVALTGVQKCAA